MTSARLSRGECPALRSDCPIGSCWLPLGDARQEVAFPLTDQKTEAASLPHSKGQAELHWLSTVALAVPILCEVIRYATPAQAEPLGRYHIPSDEG